VPDYAKDIPGARAAWNPVDGVFLSNRGLGAAFDWPIEAGAIMGAGAAALGVDGILLAAAAFDRAADGRTWSAASRLAVCTDARDRDSGSWCRGASAYRGP